jgi:hypothetical protein
MQPWRCAFLCAPQPTCAQRRTPARSEIRRLAQIGQHAAVPFAASSIIGSSQVGWRGELCRQADDEARAAREQRRHEDPGVGIERIAVVNVLFNQPQPAAAGFRDGRRGTDSIPGCDVHPLTAVTELR